MSAKIEKFITQITNTYSTCDAQILRNIWDEINNKVSRGCVFKLLRGQKKGQECGRRAKTGTEMCPLHIEATSKSKSRENSESPSGSPKPLKLGNRIFRNHPILDVLYHEETNLVFRSARERVVIGIIKNNVLCPLSDEDIEIAKKWSFNL